MPGVSSRSDAFWLVLIIATYLIVGTLFAVYTPDWQAPDEPAHYNYVRYLAEQGRFPVLQPGDYPHQYLEEIKARKFPPELSIDPIRYEFHQPPLYYLLATPVFKLFGGALVPLRLLSVALGAVLVYTACRLALAVCPPRPALALGAAAFVAFLPMHVATTATVNNDTLAELLLALALWGLVRYLRGEKDDRKALAVVGLLLGLGLLTKIYALIAVAVGVAAVVLRQWRGPRRAAGELAWLLVPALLLALPWLVRNAVVYGWPDVMGLARHDEVVLGQPTTAKWIADYGWKYLFREGLRTTYHSFWGMFGWMAVFMDRRIYLALGVFSAVAVAGLIWRLATVLRPSSDLMKRSAPAVLLGLVTLLTLLSYLWYNTKFVQHQGRYLFPALMPLGLGLALGWATAVCRVRRLITGVQGADRIDGLLFASPYAGLAVLDVVCLFAFIVPYLS
jgi:4-amino-4-deoxy-L-arabinose transferase-like glycosyltransferase